MIAPAAQLPWSAEAEPPHSKDAYASRKNNLRLKT